MANITKYIDKITVPSGSDTITANLVDNASGYITGISYSDVTTALGYTPANKMIISRGTEITTGTYSIDVSYSDIVAALAQGINPVFADLDYIYPFVGYFVDNNIPLIVFGESVIVNGQATTQGYMIPFGTSTAIWASQIQTIPTKTSDLNNDSGFITVSDVPSAGTSATAVSTSASGGSATTWSKSDHVHSISSSTITSALGYTPYNNSNPSGYISKNLYSIQIPSNYGASGEVLGLSTGFNDHPTYHYADLTDFTVETSVTENLSTGDTVEFFINGVSYGIGTFSGNSSFDINNMVGTLTSVTCDIAESEIIFNYSGTSPFPNSFPSVDTGDDYYDILISIKKIVSNWIETTTDVWTQTVSVPGILSTDNPFVQANISTIAEQESWNLIVKGEAVTDGIIFTALSSAPTVNLSAIVMVFR